ncbi:cholinesterase 2-like isoform X2 [Diabrotica virgifera virgifera]|uniref:Carboxylic ester hydrolase n=1 Tax=Diabrotica virgifera virgifera TaxID=50390 RepID=A0ABM5KHU0_DIAVI|nr:cholinesterase 2-like isoform X2 [Diabrotica virgifera virgifera]
MLKFAFFLLVHFIFKVYCDDDLIVTLPNGQIRGITVTPPVTIDLTYYAFLGVPFAAPPTGELRFKPPQPANNWDGILEANNSKISCYQTDKDDDYQTEDCLHLNVYTPNNPSSGKKTPVLVFIYGGTFVHGHANYDPKSVAFLMRENITVVTFNYRVGPFGFLSTADTVVPGNMGLKDQQFVLKWMQNNIHLFGGDKAKVTIMGQSAGAASVTYQVLSPGSAGLFVGAIANSGTALCNWAYQSNALDTAYGIANEIDPTFGTDKTTEELLEFLQGVDASAIHATSDKYKVFAPVIEVPHDGAIISDNMYESLVNGTFNKVPLLLGFNSEESIGMAKDIDAWKKHCQGYDANPSTLVDPDMHIEDNETKLTVGNAIKTLYVGNGTFEEGYGKGIQYFSDNTFIRPIIKFAELVSKHVQNLYFYQFSYHGKLGQNNIDIPGIGKVAHAEDQRYFWCEHDSYSEYPTSDLKTVQKYVKLLVNFIRHQKPTPVIQYIFDYCMWPEVTSHYFTYLDIDTTLKMRYNPRNFSYGAWVGLYDKYAKKPFISY